MPPKDPEVEKLKKELQDAIAKVQVRTRDTSKDSLHNSYANVRVFAFASLQITSALTGDAGKITKKS